MDSNEHDEEALEEALPARDLHDPTAATADHTLISSRNPHWRFHAADAASAAAPRKFSHRYAHARMWNFPACAPANAARMAIAPAI